VKTLRVSDALQGVAASCQALAGQVSAGAPPASGAAGQPSAAAMKIGHAGVKAAATAMTARMQATGTDVAFVDMTYNLTEAQSVQTLGAVAPTS
jgi:hypothetical protein